MMQKWAAAPLASASSQKLFSEVSPVAAPPVAGPAAPVDGHMVGSLPTVNGLFP
jgi:hypothetical protein